MAKAAHAPDPLPADVRGEEWAEPVPPQPLGFVADVYATREQQILDVPKL